MSWLSGHLGQLEHPGNIQGSTNTSGMTLWHAGTLLAQLAHWHSRQTHGAGNQWWHTALSIWEDSVGTHRMVWSVYRWWWWWCGCWCWWWCFFWVRAGSKPVHTQKPAQSHKPKINPNFEIWTILDNLETILRILCLSMIEHSADILVELPCVTYENCQGKNWPRKPWFSSEFL